MNPRRIQRKRTKGWRTPEGSVYVGRPSRWGNPFRVGRGPGAWYSDVPAGEEWFEAETEARRSAVEAYRNLLKHERDVLTEEAWAAELDQLRGRDLACWCPLDQPCHADVLLELSNGSAS